MSCKCLWVKIFLYVKSSQSNAKNVALNSNIKCEQQVKSRCIPFGIRVFQFALLLVCIAKCLHYKFGLFHSSISNQSRWKFKWRLLCDKDLMDKDLFEAEVDAFFLRGQNIFKINTSVPGEKDPKKVLRHA